MSANDPERMLRHASWFLVEAGAQDKRFFFVGLGGKNCAEFRSLGGAARVRNVAYTKLKM
jgi:hypothetical protein